MAALAGPSTSTTTPATTESLKAATFQRLHPRVYFERFVAEGVRPDGRKGFGEARGVVVNLGSISTADGSCLVRLGDTTMVCGVKAEIAEPSLEDPNRGFLIPNVDLPALCSPKFKPGPPAEEAQVLSERLYDVLVGSDVLPLESLCIEPGKAVWAIYVDAMCINYDGNAFDAALVAMGAALRDARLPVAKWVKEEERVVCVRKEERVPLKLTKTLVASSFGLFASTHLLADPTAFEEPLLDTTLTVVVDDAGIVVAVTQMGSAGGEVMERCTAVAKERAGMVLGVIKGTSR